MRVAYVASRYPHISHTFIRREVEALRAEGVHVETFSVRPSEQSEDFGPSDREAARTTTVIVPSAPTTVARAHLAALRRSPRGYLDTLRATLRTSPGGLRNLVWRAFYFAEGIILWWHCDRRGVRHVHAHFANVGADLARVAARFGRAADGADRWSWSFTMHGSTEFYDVRHFELGGKAGDADAVACISDYTRSQLMLLTDPDRWSRFHVVHCGVDLDAFAPRDRVPTAGPMRILTLGRLVPEKGPHALLEAVGALRATGVDAHLTFAGDGPLRPALEALARDMGIDAHVRFAGVVPPDEVPRFYAEADVFCLPSFAEGVPVVLMEAMACELPVVTSGITGIPELVTDGVNGFLVAPGRADLVADALRRLTDPEVRARMGAAGRQAVAKSFDIDAVAPQLTSIFAGLPGTAVS